MKRVFILFATLVVAAACSKTGTENGSGNNGSGDTGNNETEKPETPTVKGSFHIDESIVLDLGAATSLGNSGHICIYKADGSKVDDIDMSDISTVSVREDGVMVPREQMADGSKMTTFMDAIGPRNGYRRIVHYTPVRVEGNKAVIRPHSSVLEYDTEYYVTVDAGVFPGFQGIGAREKCFKTTPAPGNKDEVSVSPDGKGDFCTLQGALNYAMEKNTRMTIMLGRGYYEELLFLRGCNDLTIRGENRQNCRIVYPNNEGWMNGTGGGVAKGPGVGKALGKCGGRAVMLVENCDNLTMENLCIENSFGEEKGQAECFYFNSGTNKHRLNVENCEFISFQDTFLCKGICYVHNSLIAGHCDYIWGYPKVCLFENCEIRSRAKGYIVQSRTQAEGDKGFVFLNCTLTAEDGLSDDSVWLARSCGSTETYDNVMFMHCRMCKAIRKAGWCTDGNKLPNPQKPNASAGWRECGSVDAQGNPISSGRSSYGAILTEEQAAAYSSKDKILN